MALTASMKTCSENCLVVLVEDDEAIRLVFGELLRSEGYEVLTFANGREALEGLHGTRNPCLILLDWMMPEMNGEQFLRARTTHETAGKSPVVIVSAVTNWIQPTPGAEERLPKPVDIDDFLRVVHSHCRHSLSQESAAEPPLAS